MEFWQYFPIIQSTRRKGMEERKIRQFGKICRLFSRRGETAIAPGSYGDIRTFRLDMVQSG
jgi:hypothetical protein